MEVVIWGATPLGEYLAKNMVHGGADVKPSAFVDNNPEVQNTWIETIPIISYGELKRRDLKETTILLAVKSARNIFRILGQLEKIQMANIGVVKAKVMFSGMLVDPYEKKGEVVWSKFRGKAYRIVPRIEVNLIDACNLKCKGCTHFSSIYGQDSSYPVEDYKKDLLQLRKVGHLLRLRLLGGEPFLLENLDKYIMIAREIFPETDIEVVTNGLLIPDIERQIFSALKSGDVSVVISPYPPTLKRKGKIMERLNQYGVIWHFDGEEITRFARSLTLEGGHNPEVSSANCLSAACTFLRKGKLYKCPYEGLINDFNAYYGLEKTDDSGVSVYQDKNILDRKIVDYALKPVSRCKYCKEEPEYFYWSVKANPALADWLCEDKASIDDNKVVSTTNE